MLIAIAIYGMDAFFCLECCIWNVMRYFPPFGFQVAVECFLINCMKIIFVQSSHVFSSEENKARVKYGLLWVTVLLMISAIGDLAIKYQNGCTEGLRDDECLIEN